jgi:hypothetical protein
VYVYVWIGRRRARWKSGVAIDMYLTPEQGIDQFPEARATAARLLTNNWDLVERLGRALQRDPSG